MRHLFYDQYLEPVTKFIYTLFLSLFGALTSFAQVNYTPNHVHIPLLNKRYDGDVLLSFGRGKSIKSTEIQGCFSPAQHIAIAGHYFTSGDNSDIASDNWGAKYRFAEGAIGLYHAFPKGSISLFAGVGQGTIQNSYSLGRYSRLKATRIFLQPGVAYRKHRFFAAGAFRFAYLTYPFGETDFIIEPNDLYAIKTIDTESPFLLPEVSAQTGFNLQPFQIFISLNSILMSVQDIGFAPGHFALVTSIDIGDIGQKKKNKSSRHKAVKP